MIIDYAQLFVGGFLTQCIMLVYKFDKVNRFSRRPNYRVKNHAFPVKNQPKFILARCIGSIYCNLHVLTYWWFSNLIFFLNLLKSQINSVHLWMLSTKLTISHKLKIAKKKLLTNKSISEHYTTFGMEKIIQMLLRILNDHISKTKNLKYFRTEDKQPPPLKSGHIYMKDGHYAEPNEKLILQF